MWLLYALVQENLPKDRLKSFRLIALARENSSHPTTYCVVWLLDVILMNIYNDKKQAGQRKIQNVQFEEKMSTKKYKCSRRKNV